MELGRKEVKRKNFITPALFATMIVFFLFHTASVYAAQKRANKGISGLTQYDQQRVTLRDSVIVEKSYILLGDLFENIDAKANIKVAYAPQPGGRSYFDAIWLFRTARSHGLNWRPLSRKTRAIVERSSQVIYRDEIENALRINLRNRGYKGSFEIEFSNVASKIQVATDKPATIDISELAINKSTGRFVATLVSPANTPGARRFRLTGRIHKLAEIPVVNRRLKRGDINNKSDIERIENRERNIRPSYIRSEELILGKAAKRFIAAKTPLTGGHIQRPKLIKRGKLVTISLVSAGLRLTTQGRALESGSLGDIVRIRNDKSKKIIEAKVTGANSARVSLLREIALN
ncbi:MAG: flagellar basal body P-ring formation chaperone FlgA [Pseudomonadota bacterium]|nr:flagellar basal body P-ring formation chaperone FlgA [Pseudomonadota bacterium]